MNYFVSKMSQPNKLLIFLILCFSLLFCVNCSSSACEELDAKIKKSIKNDEISEDDFSEIVKQFSNRKKNLALCDAAFVSNETDLSAFIKTRIQSMNSRAGLELGKLSNARFIFENSASMDGYIQGVTEYKTTTQNLMVLLKHSSLSPDSLNASIVNDQLYPIDNFNPESFAQILSLGKAPWNKGNRADSDLNQLIKKSLDAHGPRDLTFFLSDLMYGVNNQDPVPYLPVLKNQVLDTFLTAISEKKLSSLIIKINSKFNGTYWDYKYLGRNYKGSRPLYVLIFARPRILDSFLREIDIQKLIGYENHLRLDFDKGQSEGNNKQIKFSFFCNSITVGKCDADKIEDKAVKSIESIRANPNGKISIPICASIGDSLDIPKSYFLDVNNYDSVEPFQLTIDPVTEFKANGIDKTFYKHLKPDVCYYLNGSDIKNFPFNVSITLLDRLPSWVSETTIIDDSKGKDIEFKTFGFQYFVEGMYAAYQKANKKKANFFSIDLKID